MFFHSDQRLDNLKRRIDFGLKIAFSGVILLTPASPSVINLNNFYLINLPDLTLTTIANSVTVEIKSTITNTAVHPNF